MKIVIEVKKATEGQVKSLLADLAMSIEPWKRYIHYKIKKGNKVYKRQAPSPGRRKDPKTVTHPCLRSRASRSRRRAA